MVTIYQLRLGRPTQLPVAFGKVETPPPLKILGVVKYEQSLYFQQLCDSCMSTHAFSPSLQSKLFPRSSPNPNEQEHMHAHTRVAEIPR